MIFYLGRMTKYFKKDKSIIQSPKLWLDTWSEMWRRCRFSQIHKKKKKKIQSWQLHRLSLDPQTGLVEFNQNVEQKIMF